MGDEEVAAGLRKWEIFMCARKTPCEKFVPEKRSHGHSQCAEASSQYRLCVCGVCVWCVYLDEEIYVHVLACIWRSQVNLGCPSLEIIPLVFWDSISHWPGAHQIDYPGWARGSARLPLPKVFWGSNSGLCVCATNTLLNYLPNPKALHLRGFYIDLRQPNKAGLGSLFHRRKQSPRKRILGSYK